MEQDSLIIKPKRFKGDDGHRSFTIRVPEDLAAKLDDIADRSGRSRNEIICTFLAYAADRCKIEGEP